MHHDSKDHEVGRLTIPQRGLHRRALGRKAPCRGPTKPPETPQDASGKVTFDGYILVTSLFALLLLATAATLILTIVAAEHREQNRHRRHLDLRAMNDALVAETLAELALSNSFRGIVQRSVGAGTGDSIVTKITVSRSYVKTTAVLSGATLTTGTMINLSSPVPKVLSWQRLAAR